MLDKFFKKESPILGLLGMGGGIARAASALGPLEITGASVTSYSNSTHTWIVQTTTNPITTNRGFDAADEVEIVLVGGGGAGSSNLSGASGGGGGGGVVFVPKSKGPEIITAPGTYPITIGDGGTAGVWGATPSNGGGHSQISSVAIPLLARGGGRGGGGPNSQGGSGGGGDYSSNGGPGKQPTDNPGVSGINQYGTPGRRGRSSPNYKGGGGGGAGQGGPPDSSIVGGGDGIPVDPVLPGFMTPSFPTPIINDLGGYPNSSPDFDYFGGGAGGGQRGGGATPYGLGGGGQGAGNPGPPGTAGKNGRGGGGGGGAEGSGPASQAGSGGSGCFILRFKII